MYLYILHYTNNNSALDYTFCGGAAFELLFMITSDFSSSQVFKKLCTMLNIDCSLGMEVACN